MVRTVFVIILFAFTLASGGVHKLAYSYDQSTLEVSSSQEVVKAGVKQCCANQEKEADMEKPRCLGDNCISTIASIFRPDSYRSKIRPYPDEDLGNIDLIRFLRPPIA